MKRYLLIVLILLVLLPLKINAASLLSNLEVEGIGSLNLSKRSWNLGFSTSLNYVNITATPSDSSVIVEGDGKINIKEGSNLITITASKGSEKETYTINLNVTKKDGTSGTSYDKDGNELKNPNTGAFMSLAFFGVLSVLPIISLIYLRKMYLFEKI